MEEGMDKAQMTDFSAVSFLDHDLLFVVNETHDEKQVAEVAEHLLADVYVAEEATTEDAEAATPFPVYGNAEAQVLVIVKYPAGLPDNDRTLLSNILKAKDFNIEDVALVNMSEAEGFGFAMLREHLPATFILTFGLSEADIPELRGLQWNVARKGKTLTVCPTNSLSLMHNDRDAKLALWNMIKGLPIA